MLHGGLHIAHNIHHSFHLLSIDALEGLAFGAPAFYTLMVERTEINGTPLAIIVAILESTIGALEAIFLDLWLSLLTFFPNRIQVGVIALLRLDGLLTQLLIIFAEVAHLLVDTVDIGRCLGIELLLFRVFLHNQVILPSLAVTLDGYLGVAFASFEHQVVLRLYQQGAFDGAEEYVCQTTEQSHIHNL